MKRYLVIIPRDGPQSLFEHLGRLAAREPSEFHLLIPRWPQVNCGSESPAEGHLQACVRAFAAQGLAADGEIGEVSVVGSVARAAERSRYDTLVVPVPDTLGLDAIRLDVACRLHQIDIPEVVMLTRCEVCASGDSDACDAASGDKRDGSTTRHAVTGIVVALRSFFAAILRHWHHPANDVRTVGAALLVPIRQGPIRGGQRLSRGGAESDDFGARAGSSSKSITDGQQRAPRRGKFDYPLVGGGNCSVEWAGPAAEAATGSGP